MDILQNGVEELGLYLNAEQRGQFDAYYHNLIDWNRRMNLTAITDYEEVQVKHFLDSLTVIPALGQHIDGLRIIDVGTGAGLPGLPLKIMMPDIKLTLLEATSKKTAFLTYLVQKLGIDTVEIVTGRAEEVAHQDKYREKFDFVFSRATAPLSTLVELTLPFCVIGGRFIGQKKGDISEEINQSDKAIAILGGNLRAIMDIKLEEFTDERKLVIVDKIAATPPEYPRRTGIPNKRPLN